MRPFPTFAAAVVAAAAFAAPLSALTEDESRHLLVRTGFNASPAEIQALVPLERAAAVDAILAGTYDTAPLAAPEWCANPLADYLRDRKKDWDEAYAKPEGPERDKATNALRDLDSKRGHELKRWWYRVMIATPSPLSERMTLFWHNHFTSNLETVEDPRLMYEQNVTLRKYACENFGHFAKAIPYDPAMFRFLDSNSNTRGRPNENFAREVMELFTVGEGHYTENDIKEAARAFTGYKLDGDGKVSLSANRHDAGKKTVLGNTGMFDADKILETLLVKEEDVALYLAGKFYREFIDEIPEDAVEKKAVDKEIWEIAAAFYKSRYNIKIGLRKTLMSDRFWDAKARGDLIKSPVELLVGTVRALGIEVKNAGALVEMGKKLGEDVMDPPNVKGWNGGPAWISTHSIMSRWEVMGDIANGALGKDKGEAQYAMVDTGMGMAGPDEAGAKKKKDKGEPEKAEKKPAAAEPPGKWLEDARKQGAEGVALAAKVMLPIPPVNDLGNETNVDNAVRKLLLDPAYNLK